MRLVHVHFTLVTFMKGILSQSTDTDAGEMNYVDKNRVGWGLGGRVESPRAGSLVTKGYSFENVHLCPLEGDGGQNWVEFGPRSC